VQCAIYKVLGDLLTHVFIIKTLQLCLPISIDVSCQEAPFAILRKGVSLLAVYVVKTHITFFFLINI